MCVAQEEKLGAGSPVLTVSEEITKYLTNQQIRPAKFGIYIVLESGLLLKIGYLGYRGAHW